MNKLIQKTNWIIQYTKQLKSYKRINTLYKHLYKVKNQIETMERIDYPIEDIVPLYHMYGIIEDLIIQRERKERGE